MDYSFISGQVRAQESRLLTLNRLDRMIGAKTPEEAFQVMSELSYADLLEEGTRPQNFEKIIQRGLWETKHMLMSSAENDPGLNFIWLRFDLNNLKRALKLSLLTEEKTIENFSQANGFSNLGNLDQKAIETIVMKKKATGGISDELFAAVLTAETTLAKNDNEFRFVEYALDQAYFSTLYNATEETSLYGDSFLADLFAFLADMTNFRSLARSVFVIGEKVPEQAWIPFGNMSYAQAQKIENMGEFTKWAEATIFARAVADLEEAKESENLTAIEKYLDRTYQEFLDNAVLGEVASVQIPFTYMEKRLQNSRLLKFIMFAKFHGLSPDEIYKIVEKF